MVRETIVECVKWETNSHPNCAVARLSYLQSRDLYDLAFHNMIHRTITFRAYTAPWGGRQQNTLLLGVAARYCNNKSWYAGLRTIKALLRFAS